jgi:hypothetical protein
VPATDAIASRQQQIAQHPSAGERMFRVQPIDLTHQRVIRLGNWDRRVVERTARELQRLGLAREQQSMVAIDHRFALDPSIRPSARSKKSFSSDSWPILACRSLMSGPLLFGPSPPNSQPLVQAVVISIG